MSVVPIPVNPSESMVRISAIHQLLKRLKPAKVDAPFQYRTAA
jgi:hypothetical protein